MSWRSHAIGPVLLLALAVGCAVTSKRADLGPWTGLPTPPIEGVDSAGRPLRLADYRGKVVLVSFWNGL